MHELSFATMKVELDKLRLPAGSRVLDVGSRDENGSYRPLVEAKGWRYVGVDIREGTNVDLIVSEDALWTAGMYDAIISGSTIEHVLDLKQWIVQVARLLKPEAWLLVYTHHAWPEHRHPVDCWRVLPDGLRWLFDQAGCLVDYHIYMVDEHDLFGKARAKPMKIAFGRRGVLDVNDEMVALANVLSETNEVWCISAVPASGENWEELGRRHKAEHPEDIQFLYRRVPELIDVLFTPYPANRPDLAGIGKVGVMKLFGISVLFDADPEVCHTVQKHGLSAVQVHHKGL